MQQNEGAAAAPLSFDRTAGKAGSLEAIAPGIRRLVADNPGPLTFTGTNTYLIGHDELAVIDAGPDSEAHRAAILAAAGRSPITHVVLTHTHRDHSAGMAKLAAATGARTCAFGAMAGDAAARRASAAGNDRTRGFFHAIAKPDVALRDGDTLIGAGWTLTALHTPGHAPDHLCFGIEMADAAAPVLVSGDHVMGWNTSVIAPPEGHMASYLASLERLLARPDRLYLPGHGAVIAEPQRTVRAYLVHRQLREAAVLDVVRDGISAVPAIRDRVYKGIGEPLQVAAALSVLAHLESLVERGLVTVTGGQEAGAVTLDAQFSAAG